MKELEPIPDESYDLVSVHSSKHSSMDSQHLLSEAKLPKLILPRFSDDVFDWTPFYDAYMAHIGNNASLSPIAKFSHLLSLLDGEAARVVKSFKLTAANYKPALEHLVDRFGRPAFIKLKHINALLQLELPTGKGTDYVNGLWHMLDDITAHTHSLSNLGMKGNQIEAVLCPIIIGRFPKSFRDEWSRDSKGHESDLKHTLKFIRDEVERLERSEAFQTTTPTARFTQEKVSNERKKSSASALCAASEVTVSVCGFCKGSHKTFNCYRYKRAPIHIRRQKVRDARLCFRCLQPHFASACTEQCQCCSGQHHRTICSNVSNQGTSQSAESSYGSTQAATQGFRKACNAQQGSTQGVSVGPTQAAVVSGGITQDTRTQPATNLTTVALSDVDTSLVTPNLSTTATVLQTAKIYVKTSTGQALATVLFDSAADRTYVSSSLVKLCQPKKRCQEYISYSSFGGERANTPRLSSVYDLQLLDMQGETHILSAAEMPVICAPLVRTCVPQEILEYFSHVSMADDYSRNRYLEVDILVGIDFYWKLIGTSPAVHREGLVALPSVFGYILSGCWTSTPTLIQTAQLLCSQRPCEENMANFWNLETVGIMPKESLQGTIDKNPILTRFNEELEYSPSLQRYQVALPFKKSFSADDMVNNIGIAVKRLYCLHKKLGPESTLLRKHYEVLQEYEDEKIVEAVPQDEIHKSYGVYYMPHRPIVKESSQSTRVRPVFDCSSKSYNGMSLNDLLETGPSLNPDLVSIMIRFRCWPVALSGDVIKAFLQIYTKPLYRDLHRFVILVNNKIIHMRFTRIPFGNTCSPFSLNAVVRFHLSSFPDDEVVQDLRDNMYVDNYIGGADSEEMALEKYKSASQILASAGLTLSKWTSNSQSVSELFFKSDVHSGNSTEKILGVKWSSLTDSFYFEGFEKDLEFVSTKRAVLSILSRIFDPLGFICPYILKAKVLFQKICRLGLDWDDPLPKELDDDFQAWLKDSRNLNNLEIQRPYFPHVPWTPNAENIELIGFGDACEYGYGAVVYIRLTINGLYEVYLVDARSRVAPMKRVSIPRLELLSSLLCARLVDFVKTSLKLNNVKIYCYSDSTACIDWIKGDPLQYKPFVANRLTEILELVPPVCWQHVPGVCNPADIASRGLMASELVKCEYWFRGPSWLRQHETFPHETFPNAYEVSLLTIETELLEGKVNDSNNNIFNFENSSSLTKIINYVARVHRFIHNCRSTENTRKFGPLTSSEISGAQTQVWRSIQQEHYGLEIHRLGSGKPINRESFISKLNPFLDDQGVLRVTGRIENSELDYDAKHPIIIPEGHIAKLLIRSQHINMHHAGLETVVTALRQKYWIIKLHKLAKNIIRNCIPCQRHDSRACNEVAAPLPKERISKAPPFYITGIDYAGPLYSLDFPSQKLYILLFTCGVIRAVHLELTESLQTSEFILALRRFTARRGVPGKIYSDNAKTFTAAATQMTNIFGVHAPEWQFITPRAPWWGGWWERLVRSVKSSLRKSLGQRSLKKKELETILVEIECTINSRPLTRIYGNPDDEGPITPSHFLMEQPLERCQLNDIVRPLSASELSQRYYARQLSLSKFWKIWQEQYITNLPQVVKNHKKGNTLAIGDIVLIREENFGSRLNWPLARVVKLHSGRDGLIRSVDLKTSKSIICRPIKKLHKLEVNEISRSQLSSSKTNESNEIVDEMTHTLPDRVNVPDNDLMDHRCFTTRSGRISKPPDRYQSF